MGGCCGCEVEVRRLQDRQRNVSPVVLVLNVASLWPLRPPRRRRLWVSPCECARNDTAGGLAVRRPARRLAYRRGLAGLLREVLPLAVFPRSAWRVFRAARQALAGTDPFAQGRCD